MIDNSEVEEVTTILEELEDQQLAVSLLQEFNEKTRLLGELLMNRDPSLDHEAWKKLCDQARRDVESLVDKIRDLA